MDQPQAAPSSAEEMADVEIIDRRTGYASHDFSRYEKLCDLVMKGGITSGVVYPFTVIELAKTYRFRRIGGTSAGALAAAITAAAEHSRHKGGFQAIAAIPDEISTSLFGMFQPEPRLQPLFRIATAALGGRAWTKPLRIFAAAAVGYWKTTALILLAGAGIGAFGWMFALPALLGAAIVATLVGWPIGLIARALVSLFRDLPQNGFGLCTGRTMPKNEARGLTDWLTDKIDAVAGRPVQDAPPLTFADLEATKDGNGDAKPITLRTMTTNLSMRRPYAMPFEDRIYLFREDEFRKLFPDRVVDHMINVAKTRANERHAASPCDGYWRFPAGDDLPVVVAARMSLSFPFLISAVPLYAEDFLIRVPKLPESAAVPASSAATAATAEASVEDPDALTPEEWKQASRQQRLRRCLFSDGGLSSNLPIHFFDSLWPIAPTFAVSLDDYSQERGQKRISMAKSAGEGSLLPIQAIQSVWDFVVSLLNAAKDWQDNLQSVLPGYRDRIVRVRLRESEGGLNLKMSQRTIKGLAELGAQAGEEIKKTFNFDNHRWARFLVVGKALEQRLQELKTAYGTPVEPTSFSTFLDTELNSAPPGRWYTSELPADWKKEAGQRVAELKTLWTTWTAARTFQNRPPKSKAKLRLGQEP